MRWCILKVANIPQMRYFDDWPSESTCVGFGVSGGGRAATSRFPHESEPAHPEAQAPADFAVHSWSVCSAASFEWSVGFRFGKCSSLPWWSTH
jgi:hypothetical protein